MLHELTHECNSTNGVGYNTNFYAKVEWYHIVREPLQEKILNQKGIRVIWPCDKAWDRKEVCFYMDKLSF